jgi:pre-rRNA-processing protein IPI3
MLTTFQFPQPISCLAWDPTERIFWAASPDGSIHQMNLFRQRDDKLGGQVTEAIGGAGVSDIIRVGEMRESQKKRLISVGYGSETGT